MSFTDWIIAVPVLVVALVAFCYFAAEIINSR